MFGQIKRARGFRQFLLRGIENVRAEWSLVCTPHNIPIARRVLSKLIDAIDEALRDMQIYIAESAELKIEQDLITY